MPWRIGVQFSEYSLERLCDDGEFILYRGHAKQLEPSSVLLLAPASTRPSPETLKKIDHEYSLRGELDYIATSQGIRRRLTNERRVCRPVSLRS